MLVLLLVGSSRPLLTTHALAPQRTFPSSTFSSFAASGTTRGSPSGRRQFTHLFSSSEKRPTEARPWTFQGHEVYTEVTQPTVPTSTEDSNGPSFRIMFGSNNNDNDKKCSVVLIHGFGCSSYYWRETVVALSAAGYTVHAVDLLGQGQSAKPGRGDGVTYSTHLWARLVEDYCRDCVAPDHSVVLVGNSLGSVVALAAAVADSAAADDDGNTSASATLPNRVRGIGLYNCGVGMNSRNLLKDPQWNAIQRIIFTALFDLFDFLIFDNIPLLTYLLSKVVTKDLLQNALLGLYQCAPDPAARVDAGLVDSFYYPAKQEGSVQALNQIYTNDPGPTPMELHEGHPQLGTRIPIHVIWGDQDGVTPLEGPVGRFYTQLAQDDDTSVSMNILRAGHLPFDEIPECNEDMMQWLDSVVLSGNGYSDDNRKKDQPVLKLFPFLQ